MFNYIYFDKVDSTMDKIKDFPLGSVVITKCQTKGRGKTDRTWVSKASNNLYMTFSIKADKKEIDYSQYSFLTTLCIIKTLECLIDKKIDLKTKWPNDVLLNNKKICGILLERDIQKETLAIGIGLNIDNSPNLSENMLFEPSDLKKEGIDLKNETIVNTFFNIFEKYSNMFLNFGFTQIRKEWIEYAYNFNSNIVVKINDLKINGIFEDFDKEGCLILRNDNNEIIKIRSADIF